MVGMRFVRPQNVARIGKHSRRFFERHAVSCLVRGSLVGIPLEISVDDGRHGPGFDALPREARELRAMNRRG